MALHQAWMRATASAARPRIPLVVVGSLRAGGSGKTPVAAAVARRYAEHGLRIAVFAYRLGPGLRNPLRPHLQEVFPDSDWRLSSEEAVLLAREGTARVFATRDRARAWRELDREGGCDLIVSDGGFQDPRLPGAFRVLLAAPGESPGLLDLLPAGPYRQTRRAAAGADLVLRGPLPWDAPETSAQGNAEATGTTEATLPFRARILPPPEADPRRPWAALCALGDNRRFLADLAAAGFPPRASLLGPDHAAFPEARIAAFALRLGGAGILCTRKDLLKLPPGAAARFGILAADREVALPEGLWEAVDRYREAHAARASAALPGNGILVH